MNNFRIVRGADTGPYFETLDELKEYLATCFREGELPPLERKYAGEWVPMDPALLA